VIFFLSVTKRSNLTAKIEKQRKKQRNGLMFDPLVNHKKSWFKKISLPDSAKIFIWGLVYFCQVESKSQIENPKGAKL